MKKLQATATMATSPLFRSNELDLTETLVKMSQRSKPPPMGRYYASGLWAITHGYAKVEDYLKPDKIEALSALRMWNGRWKHEQVQELLARLGYVIEKKVEYVHNDEITLVGKADAIKDDDILELKTSSSLMEKAKPWAIYQARIYCTMFEKPRAHIVQPITKGTRIVLRNIGTVTRDDEFFQEQMAKLEKFHLAVNEHVSKR